MSQRYQRIQQLYNDSQASCEHLGLVYINPQDVRQWCEKIDQAQEDELRTTLGIAPAWTILGCARNDAGHLRALAQDNSGKTQYIYDPRWTTFRNMIKYYHVIGVGDVISTVRERYTQYLGDDEVALVLGLLDETGARIGNESSLDDDVKGIHTLLKEDISLEGQALILDYMGKGGISHQYSISSLPLLTAIKSLLADTHRRRLFDVTYEQVSYRLGVLTDDLMTPKDFRLRKANTVATAQLREHDPQTLKELVEGVIDHTQNDAATSQQSYIYPGLLDIVRDDAIDSFRDRYAYTKPTTWMTQTEHIFYKYIQDEVDVFLDGMNTSTTR